MASSGNNPMNGDVPVDGFVLGGRDEGKVGRSYDGKKKKAVLASSIERRRQGKVDVQYEN